jgi:hypothetical protein
LPVAHAYNPSYSGGRDQEDHCSLKPAQANSSRDPISKNPFTKKKKGWWSTAKKKKKEIVSMYSTNMYNYYFLQLLIKIF